MADVIKSSKEKKDHKSLARRASGVLSKQSKVLTLASLERALLSQFPASDAESWDKTGILVGDPLVLVNKVAVSLDVTPESISAASKVGANVLLTHHPAFIDSPESFLPASSQASYAGSLVWQAIKSNIALVSFHTSLDVSVRAQRVLPGMLGLDFKRVLLPLSHARSKGYGQLCSFSKSNSMTLAQFSARCTSVFARAPRVWGDFSRELTTIVTCTGSAGNVAYEALRAKADCLVCGEIKYHEALELSQTGLCIVDLGHDVSELPLVPVLTHAVVQAGVPDERVLMLDQSEAWMHPETLRV